MKIMTWLKATHKSQSIKKWDTEKIKRSQKSRKAFQNKFEKNKNSWTGGGKDV